MSIYSLTTSNKRTRKFDHASTASGHSLYSEWRARHMLSTEGDSDCVQTNIFGKVLHIIGPIAVVRDLRFDHVTLGILDEDIDWSITSITGVDAELGRKRGLDTVRFDTFSGNLYLLGIPLWVYTDIEWTEMKIKESRILHSI